MNDTLTYLIGPNGHVANSVAGDDRGSGWFDVSGPAQRQSREMADRIAALERKLAALEAVPHAVA